ncbi:hypothetical protein Tco_0134034 [Tanacetum coccineum]
MAIYWNFCDKNNRWPFSSKAIGSENFYLDTLFWKDCFCRYSQCLENNSYLSTLWQQLLLLKHLLGDISNADGISSLPNTEIFDQLTLMGYVSNDDKLTFQKGFMVMAYLHKLVKNVKQLEAKLKSKTERRKARIVISDDEDDLVSEDTSKQGRMIEIEYEEVEIDLNQTDDDLQQESK